MKRASEDYGAGMVVEDVVDGVDEGVQNRIRMEEQNTNG